jgi:hypothetical protein
MAATCSEPTSGYCNRPDPKLHVRDWGTNRPLLSSHEYQNINTENLTIIANIYSNLIASEILSRQFAPESRTP